MSNKRQYLKYLGFHNSAASLLTSKKQSMNSIQKEIYKILVSLQEEVKYGSDGEYEKGFAVPSESYDTAAEKIAAFIAGASIQGNGAGVWVNGLNRLPSTEKRVFIRNVDSKVGGMVFTSELKEMNNLQNIEWLHDENAVVQGNDWISVEDGLPPVGRNVLAFHSTYNNSKTNSVDSNGNWQNSVNGIYDDVTHWQPLPTHPQSNIKG